MDELHVDPDDSWPDSVAREIEDDQAATQEALEAERDAVDEAASLAERIAPYEGADLNAVPLEVQREREAEELGFYLAWWAEDNSVPPIDTVVDLANGACAATQHLRLLQEKGYPEDAMQAQVVLDQLSGPVVVAALQILGTLHSHLRDEIKQILVQIHNALPMMTEDEEAAFAAAHQAVHEEHMATVREQFAGHGIAVISLDEAVGLFGGERAGDDESDEPTFDPDLN